MKSFFSYSPDGKFLYAYNICVCISTHTLSVNTFISILRAQVLVFIKLAAFQLTLFSIYHSLFSRQEIFQDEKKAFTFDDIDFLKLHLQKIHFTPIFISILILTKKIN